MAAKLPRSVPALTPAEAEQRRLREESRAAWGFLWTLFVFKMATVVMIYWAARDFEAAALLSATTWYWLAIPALLCASPLLFRYRLLKVRRRREQLRRAEWMLDAAEAERHGQAGQGARRR